MISKLNLAAFGKGILIAVLTTLLSGLYTVVATGSFPTFAEWYPILTAAMSAGVSYLLKNFITGGGNVEASEEVLVYSKFANLNIWDFIKSLFVAFFTVVLSGLVEYLQQGILPTLAQLGTLAIYGLAALIAYLIKNFFTNQNNELGNAT